MAKKRIHDDVGTTSVTDDSSSDRFVDSVVRKAPSSSSSSLSSSPSPASDPLGSKLHLMTTQERSNGLYDLHGVADQVQETPEMIQTKISEMTFALVSMAMKESNDTLAFRRALAKSPEYVESLKLRFLRADSYNSKEAACRMIRFFNKKLELFGGGNSSSSSKLVDDIKFEDLGKEEVDILNQGVFQLLPQRDRAGRAIVLAYGKLAVEHSIDALLRALLYFIMAVLEDEETQKSGIVGIFYGIGQTRIIQGRTTLYWRLWWALPLRQAGFHYCQNTSALDPTRFIIAKLVESKLLCRVRYHFGSEMECIYNLMTFGIAREAIPISNDGKLDLTHHHEFLETFKCRENNLRDPNILNFIVGESSSSSRTAPTEEEGTFSSSSLENSFPTTIQGNEDCEINDSGGKPAPSFTTTTTTTTSRLLSLQNIISVPGPMDILLGRGRRQEKRPGMVKFNSLLEEYWDTYDQATSKDDKTEITKLVLKQMKESKCRFLVAVPEGFQECDGPTARERIAHSFRTLRGKKQRVKNKKPNPTTTTTGKTTTKKPFSRGVAAVVKTKSKN